LTRRSQHRSLWNIYIGCPKNCTRIIQPSGHSCADPRPSRRAAKEAGMIEFLAQMPTDTMLFLTMAVLGLAATLIVLRRLI
jgi:hypothetical protein